MDWAALAVIVPTAIVILGIPAIGAYRHPDAYRALVGNLYAPFAILVVVLLAFLLGAAYGGKWGVNGDLWPGVIIIDLFVIGYAYLLTKLKDAGFVQRKDD